MPTDVKEKQKDLLRLRLRPKEPQKMDGGGLDRTESGCTIVLPTKKIKKFILLPYKHLSIFAKEKIGRFRTRDASSCKG